MKRLVFFSLSTFHNVDTSVYEIRKSKLNTSFKQMDVSATCSRLVPIEKNSIHLNFKNISGHHFFCMCCAGRIVSINTLFYPLTLCHYCHYFSSFPSSGVPPGQDLHINFDLLLWQVTGGFCGVAGLRLGN